jgi:hypothetical protein
MYISFFFVLITTKNAQLILKHYISKQYFFYTRCTPTYFLHFCVLHLCVIMREFYVCVSSSGSFTFVCHHQGVLRLCLACFYISVSSSGSFKFVCHHQGVLRLCVIIREFYICVSHVSTFLCHHQGVLRLCVIIREFYFCVVNVSTFLCHHQGGFPDFMITAQDGDKVFSVTTRPPLPPGNTPGTHFC